MSDLICPACGSSNLVKSSYHECLKEDLGGQISIEKVLYHCQDCGSEGDFFEENDRIIEDTLLSLKNDLILSILDEFVSQKISLSSIERALDLPQRTLTKWKNKISSPTATGITLFKYLKLFPWLLEVAENKFEYDTSQHIFMKVAFEQMIRKMSFSETENEFKSAGIFTSANSAFLYMHIQKKEAVKLIKNSPIVSIS